MKKQIRRWAYKQLTPRNKKRGSWLYTILLLLGIILYIWLSTR